MTRAPTEDLPDCAQFAQTLQLMDGLLTGAALLQARTHITHCETCGPLTSDWPLVARALHDDLADAAEGAKPALAHLADKALPAAEPARGARRAVSLGWWFRLLLPAAAAVAVLASWPDATVPADTAPAPVASDNDCELEELAFDEADGMVLKTEDGTTVIWITEHEDA